MFGRSRPVVIESYAHRRTGWRLPRWLLLLLGTAAGAAAVITVQQRYLPPPEGFKPRQTTVQVLDQSAGKSLGMRVLTVR